MNRQQKLCLSDSYHFGQFFWGGGGGGGGFASLDQEIGQCGHLLEHLEYSTKIMMRGPIVWQLYVGRNSETNS